MSDFTVDSDGNIYSTESLSSVEVAKQISAVAVGTVANSTAAALTGVVGAPALAAGVAGYLIEKIFSKN